MFFFVAEQKCPRNRKKLEARPYKNYSDKVISLAIEMVKTKKMSNFDFETKNCYRFVNKILDVRKCLTSLIIVILCRVIK